MRDVWLVARFEVLRAIRTWRAIALLVAYAVATGAAARVFVEAVGAMESTLARTLGVPQTDVPGAMLAELVTSDLWREAVTRMTGSRMLADHLITVPPVALFWLWVALLSTPFFAASTSAECVAVDVSTRALRYELLRTGRLELVMGRFAGQVFLALLGTIVSMLTVLGVALALLAHQSPVELLPALGAYLPRALAFSVPFVGLGVAASQLTASPAWARVLTLVGVTGSWVGYAALRWLAPTWPTTTAILLPLVPQGWIRGLWEPGLGWVPGAVACLALGVVYAMSTAPVFLRRHL